jgi:hypothetical protein
LPEEMLSPQNLKDSFIFGIALNESFNQHADTSALPAVGQFLQKVV